jgi:hypothetical protein
VSNWDPFGGEDEPPQDRLRLTRPWARPAFLDEPEYDRERQQADKEWEREQQDDEGFYYEPKEPSDG